MMIPQNITQIYLGIFAYVFAWLYGLFLLKKFDLISGRLICLTLLCLLGHLFGAIANYSYTMMNGSDSLQYFQMASTQCKGLAYWAAYCMMGYAKKYFVGESILNAFLISGAIGFIASIYFLLSYKILLNRLINNIKLYEHQILFPAFILLCWPSYLFFSAGLIKDCFSFLSVSIVLFVISNNKINLQSCLHLIVAFLLTIFIRPYIFVIFALASVVYFLLNIQKYNISYLFLIIISMIALFPLIHNYLVLTHFSGFTIKEIGHFAIQQEEYTQIGSKFPMLTHNPWLVFITLPYLFFANLLLPIGVGIKNNYILISSIENLYLFACILYFYINRSVWNDLKNQLNVVTFLIIYFVIGMSSLSLMNTNVGLAMREKIMYVPVLLICILLTYSYKNIKKSGLNVCAA